MPQKVPSPLSRIKAVVKSRLCLEPPKVVNCIIEPKAKEATTIVALRKWSHLLARRHFTLVTDQRSVVFMFDNKRQTKFLKK